jgi:hypothetical protein
MKFPCSFTPLFMAFFISGTAALMGCGDSNSKTTASSTTSVSSSSELNSVASMDASSSVEPIDTSSSSASDSSVPATNVPALLSDIEFPDANLHACVLASGVSQIAELTDLECQMITDLTGLEYLTALTRLALSDLYFVGRLDLYPHMALVELEINRASDLVSIDIGANTNLERLSLILTGIQSLNLAANTQLEFLDLAANQALEDIVFPVGADKRIPDYRIQANVLSEQSCLAAQDALLNTLAPTNTPTGCFNILPGPPFNSADFPDATLLNCVVSTGAKVAEEVTELNCNAILNPAGLENLPNLESLSVRQLVYNMPLDLSANTALTNLTISAGFTTEIILSQNTALQSLTLSNLFSLNTLDLSSSSELQSVSLSFLGALSSVDLSSSTLLSSLTLRQNFALTELALPEVAAPISTFDIANNPLSPESCTTLLAVLDPNAANYAAVSMTCQ